MRIDINQLCLYNSFVNIFLNYYRGFYPHAEYEELSKEVYKNFNLIPEIDISERYAFCKEIALNDGVLEIINNIKS